MQISTKSLPNRKCNSQRRWSSIRIFFSSRKLFTTLMCPHFEDTKLPTNPEVNDQPFGPLRLHSFMASKKKENTLPPLKLSYSYRLASAFFSVCCGCSGVGLENAKKNFDTRKICVSLAAFWGDVLGWCLCNFEMEKLMMNSILANTHFE